MPKTNDSNKTYQQLQAELDDIAMQLQSSELDAEAAVKLYETGLKLIKQLEVRLASAENKVTKLKTGN